MSLGTILLVEDETSVLWLNCKHLEEAGYRVLCARTIKEARAAVWERPPDLVILDVLLPDGSGYDFCKEFRTVSTAPVLFLTCMSQDRDVIRGLGSGGDDYMAKPYSIEVLLARVAAILRRNGLRGGVIELPPLSIDLQTGRVVLNGRTIPLSPKETQLLAFLVANAGREFSAPELYHAVWGEDGGVSVGTVKSHISKLRAKLQLDENSPFELSLTPEKKYQTVVPWPGVLSAQMVPPWASTRNLLMYSPRPVPVFLPSPVLFSSRRYRSKMWGRMSGEIPPPSSATENTAFSPCRDRVTVICPPWACRAALDSRLMSTCRSRSASQTSTGTLPFRSRENGFFVQADAPLVDGGHIQQLGNHEGQPVGLGGDHVHVAIHRGQSLRAGSLKNAPAVLGVPADHGEGRFQFVGDVAQKLSLLPVDGCQHFFLPFQLGFLPVVLPQMQVQHDPAGQTHRHKTHQNVGQSGRLGDEGKHGFRAEICDQADGDVDRQFQAGEDHRRPFVQHQHGKHQGKDKKGGHPAVVTPGGKEKNRKHDQENGRDGNKIAQPVAPGFGRIPQQAGRQNCARPTDRHRHPQSRRQIAKNHDQTDERTCHGQHVEQPHAEIKQGPEKTG